jgi:hypothetical protein
MTVGPRLTRRSRVERERRARMRGSIGVLLAAAVVGGGIVVTGCEDEGNGGVGERAGRKLDRAGEEVGRAVEDAGEAIQEAAKPKKGSQR